MERQIGLLIAFITGAFIVASVAEEKPWPPAMIQELKASVASHNQRLEKEACYHRNLLSQALASHESLVGAWGCISVLEIDEYMFRDETRSIIAKYHVPMDLEIAAAIEAQLNWYKSMDDLCGFLFGHHGDDVLANPALKREFHSLLAKVTVASAALDKERAKMRTPLYRGYLPDGKQSLVLGLTPRHYTSSFST